MHDRTLHFWDLAKSLVATLFNAFGEPQIIAARGALDRKTYAWLIAWLQACETLLRRLLLIEARALPAPPAPSRQTPPAGNTPALRSKPAFSLNPDDWRVRFRILDRRSRAAVRATTGKAPVAQARFHPAMPLARRAEALYRVCKDPLPYARRLARFLARAPHAVARILAPPRQRRPSAPLDPIAIIGRESWREIAMLCGDTS